MALFIYDSKRLIPAPFVSVQKVYDRAEDGTPVGSTFQISIRGTLVAFKGSPNSSGVFYTLGGYPADETVSSDARLGSLLRKQEGVRELFSNDGLTLEWQSLDGTPSMKCNPRITNINFSEGVWFDRTEYTIDCEADVVYVAGGLLGEDSFPEYISSASEGWSVETDEESPETVALPRSYRLTHSLTAKGKRFHNTAGAVVKPAWKWAQDWVLARQGFDSAIALSSGVLNLPSYYGGFNHSRSQSVDENGGNFSVTETWVIASGTALENYNVSVTTGSDTGLTNVKIDGDIKGLEQRDSNFNITTSKYSNADSYFTQVSGLLLSRAQTYSGLNLNISPISTSLGKNPAVGSIAYGFEYDNRASHLFDGSKKENITLSDTLTSNAFASIFVLGRSMGPVLQNLSASRGLARRLSVELIMPPETFGNKTQSEIYTAFRGNPRIDTATSGTFVTLINATHPSALGATTYFVEAQEESWIPSDGRYTYSIDYRYEL